MRKLTDLLESGFYFQYYSGKPDYHHLNARHRQEDADIEPCIDEEEQPTNYSLRYRDILNIFLIFILCYYKGRLDPPIFSLSFF